MVKKWSQGRYGEAAEAESRPDPVTVALGFRIFAHSLMLFCEAGFD